MCPVLLLLVMKFDLSILDIPYLSSFSSNPVATPVDSISVRNVL